MINPRLEALADYPFDRLRTLLQDVTPPSGLTPFTLSVGEPRHAPPPLVAEVIAACRDEWGRYPPVDGTPAFRAAVAAWLRRRFALPDAAIDPDTQILPVAGTREALFLTALLVMHERKPGRTPVVVMPNPFYQVYFGAAVMAGAEPVLLPADPDHGFLPDPGALAPDVLARTVLMYLCSPANPQGAVAPLSLLCSAVDLARAHGFVLAVDECYSEIYDDAPPPGVLAACAALGDGAANVLTFHSLSKRSSAPGLRSGFVAGDPRLIAAFRRLRSYAGATLPLPVLAASTALWQDETHVATSRAAYRRKFDRAAAVLAGRFGFYRPAGGFFLWLDVGDGEEAARALWRLGAIRALPGAYLARSQADGNPGSRYLRVALVDDEAATEQALRRLGSIL
jgi:N-succinyldiaminopimelate aminotransferase